MTHLPTDPQRDDTVTRAQQSYNDVLARWGLENFTQEELNHARAMLRSQRRSHITHEDVEFQAAFTRLQSNRHLPAKVVEDALKELLEAEYECDQAQWERECHLAAVKEHSRYKLPDHSTQHEAHQHHK